MGDQEKFARTEMARDVTVNISIQRSTPNIEHSLDTV
jgi:hypothetical protein